VQSAVATVVLVPGGFLGPWVWEPVENELRAAGCDTVAVALTSVPQDDVVAPGDLHDDAAAVRAVLDDLPRPVLVCGHSYGGAVITAAAAGPHPAVTRLVYLAGAAPAEGQRVADQASSSGHDPGDGSEGAEQVDVRADGMVELMPDAAEAALFHDVDPAKARLAVDQLLPMNPVVAGPRRLAECAK
jgi:pimeloyl-ACP methyl ester carboxylesterase